MATSKQQVEANRQKRMRMLALKCATVTAANPDEALDVAQRYFRYLKDGNKGNPKVERSVLSRIASYMRRFRTRRRATEEELPQEVIDLLTIRPGQKIRLVQPSRHQAPAGSAKPSPLEDIAAQA